MDYDRSYDRILKFGNGNDCTDCVHGGYEDCRICTQDLTAKYGLGPSFANALQLEGLIKEAESGAQKWVRENTLFVCNRPDHCAFGATNGYHCEPHSYSGTWGEYCRERYGALCLPYRGDKSEKVTWPGRTDEDCSEVEKEGRVLWALEGNSCDTCLFTDICYIHIGPDYRCYVNAFQARSIIEKDILYRNTEIKQDRSDTNYNDKKQEIEKAALKIKEEIGVGLEYVSLANITCKSLSNTDISPDYFIGIYRVFGLGMVLEANDICVGHVLYEFAPELLRLGFIEEKFSDPVVKRGSCIKWMPHGSIYRLAIVGFGRYILTNVGDGCLFSTIYKLGGKENFKLSDLVGKHRLKEFTPCKVKVEVVG